METKNYIIVHSDAFFISVNKASLTAEQHKQMLAFRALAKQRGDSLMIVEDDIGVRNGTEAIADAHKRMTAAAGN